MGKLGRHRTVNEFASSLTKQGFWCVESEFNSTLYAEKNNNLVILSGQDGIAVEVQNIPKFCKELMGVYDIIQYRRERGN